MEEKDQMLIEKYFAHELSTQEKNAMEQRLTTDAEFAMEFETYRQAVEALKLAQREELKDRFRARDKELDNVLKPRTQNFRYVWMLAAALIVMVIGIWVLNNAKGPGIENKIVTPRDTLKNLQPVPPIIRDITIQQERGPMASVDEKEKDKWNADKYDGEELFAANFEPYSDEELDDITRGSEDELSAYERFQNHYAGREYESALKAFNEMSPSMQENDNLLFLKANTLMALKQIPEAIPILERVSNSGKTGYHVEALYYLALAELHRENLSKAKTLLEVYIKESNAIEKNRATDILNKLDMK